MVSEGNFSTYFKAANALGPSVQAAAPTISGLIIDEANGTVFWEDTSQTPPTAFSCKLDGTNLQPASMVDGTKVDFLNETPQQHVSTLRTYCIVEIGISPQYLQVNVFKRGALMLVLHFSTFFSAASTPKYAISPSGSYIVGVGGALGSNQEAVVVYRGL